MGFVFFVGFVFAFCGICFFFVVCLPNEREIPQLQPEKDEFSFG